MKLIDHIIELHLKNLENIKNEQNNKKPSMYNWETELQYKQRQWKELFKK